jgi:serine/threonine protein kinase
VGNLSEGNSRLRMLAPLGRGGMSDVWLAATRGPAAFEKLVAVKQLRLGEDERDPERAAAFLREARLAALLNHPNIVQTFEILAQGGDYRIVMEFLEGRPLNQLLKRMGTSLGLQERIWIVGEVLVGLHYAHELHDPMGRPLGVVHRDVSHHNVFLTWDGSVKLLDFGVAAFARGDRTMDGIIKGKLAYMAPEQARGEEVDRRADVFSVGVMLWELLAHRRMWAGLSEPVLYQRLAAGIVPSIHEAAPETPEILREICEQALAPDPNERPATAAALRHQLEGWLAGQPWRADARQIGAYAASFFEVERATLAGLIADALSDTESEGEPTRLYPAQSSGQSTPQSIRSRSQEMLLPVGSALAPEPRTSSLWLLTGFAAGALLLGVGGVAGLVSLYEPPPPEPEPLPPVVVTVCPTERAEVVLSGDIEEDATLSCQHDYRLVGPVRVLEGATLTVEPGTVVAGEPGSGALLLVSTGARLVAVGEAARPIVFTSARHKDPAGPQPGDWGGLVLLGRAPTNQPEPRLEGLAEAISYGGVLPDDNSGELSYVRIEYAGVTLAPNNETNGLTLAGVGRGTRIDHVQVLSAADDCFEFFGGTVDASDLICVDPRDDGFDFDQGYQGTVRSVVMLDRQGGEGERNGIEVDNDAQEPERKPRTSPTVEGATLCGSGPLARRPGYGLLVRRGAAGRYEDLLVGGFTVTVETRDRSKPKVGQVAVSPCPPELDSWVVLP